MEGADRPLFTRSFVGFNVITFISFCNIAVFFQFHDYLETLPIDPRWIGFLIAVFSLVVLAVRPFISPFLHETNSRKWLLISTGVVMGSLFLYDRSRSLEAMTLVRLVHGVGYGVMNTALVGLLVGYIPPGKSGQAFGLFSIITLLPYALVPPVLKPVMAWAGGFGRVLDLSALLMALIFPLALLLDPAVSEQRRAEAAPPLLQGLRESLGDPRILFLLFASLAVWTTFAPVFFFIEPFGRKLGISNVGWFFTLSTFAEIGVRIGAGKAFDRFDKPKVLGGAMIWLGIGFLFLGGVSSRVPFLLVGIFLGVGWGVVMPLLTAIVFDISLPRYRALNTNLTMVVFQGGFFLGPLIGAAVLLKWGYGMLYSASGMILLLTAALLLLINKRRIRPSDGASSP
jgi:predicted MFS family arabinose efflux permease